MKGKVVVSVTKNGWLEPEPLVMLYALYLFADHSEGLYSFTLSDLMDDSDDREAMSPKLIFGVDSEPLIHCDQSFVLELFSSISTTLVKIDLKLS